MNLRDSSRTLRRLAFRIARVMASLRPGGRIAAFGAGDCRIGSILVINLKRQPKRWRRVLRELGRFQTFDGAPLVTIARRFGAVDARDGRAVAATADVDPRYRIGDQLYVQPDTRLAECFGTEEPVWMTRQEVAIARSHIEVWKAVAKGRDKHVLVLEDDVWFRNNAPTAIDRGWRAALRRCSAKGGPHLLYLSYDDAGGTAGRAEVCDTLFRAVRGLWFLSGYVLSREGAAALLRAMPVVGPVDLWINYRFEELGALALSSPVILQRQDDDSENSYSVLPYLARAGIVDGGSGAMAPRRTHAGPVLAWSAGGEREGLAMALSMLGLRVRVFDGNEEAIPGQELSNILEAFDALVDPPLAPSAISVALASKDCKFILEAGASFWSEFDFERLPPSRTTVMAGIASWEPLCALLGLAGPVQTFPIGARRNMRVFRDGRLDTKYGYVPSPQESCPLDDSPWVLPQRSHWQPRVPADRPAPSADRRLVDAAMTTATPSFPGLVGTFPGNLASFAREALVHDEEGVHIVISKSAIGSKPYRSGAFASERSFEHGRFEAEIIAARGAGLITGFFLHRDAPRQEIDIELTGDDPRSMLVNVFFNPGDDGAAIGFGYRGSPHRIELAFDATLDRHLYTIDWRPGRIIWLVDGRVVHERVSWDPTPLPHLPMRLHANLWAPRSKELAGQIAEDSLPATATFRNVSVRA